MQLLQQLETTGVNERPGRIAYVSSLARRAVNRCYRGSPIHREGLAAGRGISDCFFLELRTDTRLTVGHFSELAAKSQPDSLVQRYSAHTNS